MRERKLSQHCLTALLTPDIPCELCGGSEYVTDMYTGEEICTGCGFVVNDIVFSRLKRGISQESSGRTPHPRHSLYDRGMNTTMFGTKDAFGVQLKRETIETMKRLQRSDTLSKTSDNVDRNLNAAMAELDRLCSVLSLPLSVKEKSAVIYRKALSCDLIRGRSIDAFVAASIYTACRIMKIPRLLKTVSEFSKRDQREVGKTYRFLIRELKLKTPLDTPYKYIPRIISLTDAPRTVELRAIEIIRDAKTKHVITGKDPMGVAGAAVLLASELEGYPLVQKSVSDAAEVTGITLRSRYRGLKKALNLQ